MLDNKTEEGVLESERKVSLIKSPTCRCHPPITVMEILFIEQDAISSISSVLTLCIFSLITENPCKPGQFLLRLSMLHNKQAVSPPNSCVEALTPI